MSLRNPTVGRTVLIGLFCLVPAEVAGQIDPNAGAIPRVHGGLGVAVAQPLGEFEEYVRVGGGIQGFFRVDLDQQGRVALRIHGGFLTYGNETHRVCFSETVGCRIELDLTTSNNIFVFGIGPELGVPLGGVRGYGNVMGGLGYFSTDSQVGGTVQNEPFASTRNYGDGGFAWSAGGGIEVPLGSIQQLPISLDLGLSYQGNGRREYLTRGGIIDRPDGSLEFDVKRSEANFLMWRLGISVGIVPES